MLTTEYQEFIIDIAASGLNVATEGVSLNFGGYGPEFGLFIKELGWYDVLPAAGIDYAEAIVATEAKLLDYIYPGKLPTCGLGEELVGGECQVIVTNPTCEDGETAVDGTCVPTIVKPDTCEADETLVNGTCERNESPDPKNPNTGLIVGISVGVIATLSALIVFLKRFK